ncbi:MAG TPA: MBL fold metallo-hydrolase [Terriglobales bacterium]|jgi:phosphoribosyl 1,2-cyclic phosphodiesterase|nr:MBL fold metallo-hydrolase [Terriglobales bacterium]
MAVTITVLASGSRGNATLVASSKTRLLVDAGISCKETFKRLRALGEAPERLDAILISHEHSDHVYGLPVLARKLKVPVYMTGPCNDEWGHSFHDAEERARQTNLDRLELFASGRSLQIGDIEVFPFTIPHDAADPVAFTFRTEGIKVSVATDLGYMPPNVKEHLRGSDVLMVESNHDLEMLRNGAYPWSVKQRVMSRVGHLSNEALADFFSSSYDGSASVVILAHLSEQNNHPEIAREAAERALAPRRSLLHNRLLLAQQDAPLEPVRL